jgi:hypothetical protein
MFEPDFFTNKKYKNKSSKNFRGIFWQNKKEWKNLAKIAAENFGKIFWRKILAEKFGQKFPPEISVQAGPPTLSKHHVIY